MKASVQCRSIGIVMKDDDDGLALFLDLRSQDKENDDILRQNSKDFDDQLGSKPDGSLIHKITSAPPAQKTGADDFLNSENDKTGYDRLLKTPGTPLFPLLEESKKIVISQNLISDGLAAVPKSGPANLHAEPASRKDKTSGQPVLSSAPVTPQFSAPNSSIGANVRPLSSGGLTSTACRHATIGHATLPTTARPSRTSTPTPQGTLSATAKPSRSSTPTLLARLSSTKTAAPLGRSSAPTRSMARSSTPPARSSVPAAVCKAISRFATPRSRPSTPSNVVNTRKLAPPKHMYTKKLRSATPRSRSGSDDTSPVLIGTRMVERVVNMRKLAPPKQDDQILENNNSSGKSLLSRQNSGFGRTLSKTSLDMALRHMGITQSIPGDLHPLETNMPASSVCSVRSGSTKSTTPSVLDSPLATSNASSETNVYRSRR